MKLLNLLAITAVSLGLFACNAGDDSSSSSDVQSFNLSGNSSGSGAYSIQGKATNCITTPNNCQVSITYSSSGNLNPSVLNYAITGQAASQLNCANSNGNSQTCNFTIYGTSSSSGQPVTFIFNGVGHAVTSPAFNIGGSL